MGKHSLYFLFLIDPCFFSCDSASSIGVTSHLDSLYEEREVGRNISIGYFHIYSNFPDYKPVEATGEGIACIDDAARAGEAYLKLYQLTGRKHFLSKVRSIVNFVLYLQSPNGYFWNFIYKDGSINKLGITSRAEPNWWSYRAFLFLQLARVFLDSTGRGRIDRASERFMFSFEKDQREIAEKKYFDQYATVILGLLESYKRKKSKKIGASIEFFSNILLKNQLPVTSSLPGAFLSAHNLWHAYGNEQASALISAGFILGQSKYIDAGIKEIDHFYRYLLSNSYYSSVFFHTANSAFVSVREQNKFPQIAYGIRPMIQASLKAYEVTNNRTYAELAVDISRWFSSKNIANQKMYVAATGICFDGIDAEDRVNANSGAESTIEALLSFLSLYSHAITREETQAFMENL